MFEALLITLREGVEAVLILAIALTLLERRGLARLRVPLFAGAAAALAAAAAVAAAASRLHYDQELAEGIAMLVGAALVLTLAWWMWRAAPHMKREIESGLERVVGAGDAGATAGGGAFGVFVFAFGMVFREGVETAIFLSAAGFNSQGLGMVLGAVMGLGLALVFGVLFVRGSLRVPLKPFFSITTAALLLIGFQLVVGGLHELSEAQVLPASRTEMALIGPLIKNELLFFTLTLALVAGWLLLAPRPAPAVTGDGAAGRLARAALERDTRLRRWTGLIAALIVAMLATAFVRSAHVPPRPPAEPLAADSSAVWIEAATLADGHPHFFELTTNGTARRFFAIEVGGEVRTCLDACEICGDLGYFEDHGTMVCRNCTSPIATSTLGRTGGCNPIPLPHRTDAGRIRIEAADLAAGYARIRGD